MKLIQKTILRFKKGNSDKVYEADLLESGDGYLVHFRYGKFGANLREGVKTKDPIVFAKAEKIYHSLIVSKINKGYHVSSGFDPVKNRTVEAKDANATSNFSLEEQRQSLFQRLLDFSQNKADVSGKIDNYTLNRTLWKAGDLKVPNIAPVLEALLKIKFKFKVDKFYYYSMLYALGRSKDSSKPDLLGKLSNIKKTPKNTDYMQDEVRFSLTQNNQDLPQIDTNFNCVDIAEDIALFEQYETLSLSKLPHEHKRYFDLLMNIQGISDDINQALKKITLKDINIDYLKTYLSAETYQIIIANKPAIEGLKESMQAILKDIHNHKMDEGLAKYKKNYDIYQETIVKINLRKLFSNNIISYITEGRIDWLWGDDKKKLKKALVKVGMLSDDLNRVFNHVQQYQNINNYYQKLTIKEDNLIKSHEHLAELGINENIFNGYNFKEGIADWLNYRINDKIRCQYDGNIKSAVERLFQHQFEILRTKKLKTKSDLLVKHQIQVLARYRQAVLEPSTRSQVLDIIRQIEPSASLMQTFRRLYKIAEFRDDAEVLGILNYRLEITKSSGQSYYPSLPFQTNTKNYFRRRFVRMLKQIAKFTPEQYTTYAKHVLIQVDDHAKLAVKNNILKQTTFPTFAAFNFILHQNSHRFKADLQLIWHFKQRRNEKAQTEAYPQLWDNAADDLLEILIQCKAQMVDAFAYKRLVDDSDFLATVDLSDWQLLVQKPFQETALLALDYLTPHLQKIDVMKAILNAQFDEIRQKMLDQMDGESLGEQLELLKLMLFSKHKNVHQFAVTYLYTAKAHYVSLSEQLLSDLTSITDEKERTRLIKVVKWLLLHPLKDQCSLASMKLLLGQSDIVLQQLAADLLEKSKFSFDELKDCYQLMNQSEYAEIRAGAISLLAKLDNAEKIKSKTMLFDALLDGNPALRKKSIRVLKSIKDNDFRLIIFDTILPHLFKSEPHDGFNDDILSLMVSLKPIYKTIDKDLLWRLLQAKSKLAQYVGALILTSCKVNDWSIKQLVLLTKNPILTVRDWAMAGFIKNPQLANQEDIEAMRLLDNSWDDTRQQAIEFFKQFDQTFWDSSRIISVCDQIYEDVQQFGRELITTFFEQSQGEAYLIKLSQHPSQNIQLFVSGFLTEYATDKADIIVNLTPYFQTVLSQVNRGRIIKDRIIDFLFKEAHKDEAVAIMVIALFSEQSISMVIADKMIYIQTLFELQHQFNQPAAVIKTIEAEVRSV